MPRIHTYEATTPQVKVEPSQAGYSAEEMAGRRIGPFYEQIARGEEGLGRLTQERIDGEKGLLEFARLAATGIGVKYGGGLKSGAQLEAGGSSPNIAALNYMSKAAPVVSQVAKQLVQQATPQFTDFRTGGYVKYDKEKDPAKEQQQLEKNVNDFPFLPPDKQQQEQTDRGFLPNNSPNAIPQGLQPATDGSGGQTTYDANGNPLTNSGTQGTTNPAPIPAEQQVPSVWDEIGQGQAAGAGGTS